MALSKITYNNKVSLNPQPSVANENKVTDNDMNEIKIATNGVVDMVKSNNLFSGFLSGAYNSSTGVFNTSTSGIASRKIDVVNGEKYCLSGIQAGNTIRILFWNNGTFISSTTLTTQTENVITMLGNRFAFQTATSTPHTNIQLEKGESATAYTPYMNLDGQEFYSGMETKIGEWIDGKPLYRRVFTYTNLSQISSGSYGTISTGLANTTRIVKVEGLNTNSSLGLTRALPYTDNTNLLRIITTSNGAEIRLYVNGSLFTANDDATVILYYIKTTD